MKSAYELAMERLQKEDPQGVPSLSDEQRRQLAEIDNQTQARLAEKEVFLRGRIEDARRNHDVTALEQLQTQLKNERDRIREKAEAEKNRIRNSQP